MYQVSIKCMEAAIKSTKSPAMIALLNPLLVATSVSLTGVHIWMGAYASAEECLGKTENKPNPPLGNSLNQSEFVTKAELKIRQGKLAEAESLIAKATQSAKPLGELASLDALRVRARIEMSKGDLAAAQEALNKAFATTTKFLGDSHPLNLDLIELQRDLFAKSNDAVHCNEFANRFETLRQSSQDKLYGR